MEQIKYVTQQPQPDMSKPTSGGCGNTLYKIAHLLEIIGVRKKGKNMSHFAERLREVINQHCRENASNTPDFILSEYLFRCLDAFDAAVRERDHWHHLHPMPWTTRVLEERPLDTMEGEQLRTTPPACNAAYPGTGPVVIGGTAGVA